MIKKIIQKFISKEQRFSFEMHNGLLWYFSIEHPAPPVSDFIENPFFMKYGFLILKNINNENIDPEEVIDFLHKTTPETKNCEIIFGKKRLYFSDWLKFIDLNQEDFIIFNSNKVKFFS